MMQSESISLNLRMFSTCAPFLGGETGQHLAHADRLGGECGQAETAGNRNTSMSGRSVSGSAGRKGFNKGCSLPVRSAFRLVLA